MSGSGFSYKGVDIGNVVTSNNSSSPTFSSYNLFDKIRFNFK